MGYSQSRRQVNARFLLARCVFIGRGLALLLLLPALTALGADATPDQPTCLLLTVEGKIEVARKGTLQWTAGQANQILQPGDRLRTGLRSRATLRWSDLSVTRVNELTSLEIRPPAKDGQKPELDLKSGASYFFSREKPMDVQFRTPVASGAIRGTEFHLAVQEDGRTVLSLLDGEVELSAAQQTETLNSGEQGVVEPGRAPKKSALINANGIIQWVLYYPAVVDPDEIGLSAAEQAASSESLQAYRSGDLLSALSRYPENRQPATDPERVWRAALLLAAGQVGQTETSLAAVTSASPLARALRELIATVKNEKLEALAAPTTTSEWLARSYTLQSRSQLAEALAAAREATTKSPSFGAAWLRVAELEFSFGRTPAALAALQKGLELSPRHAEGLALRGFLLAARNRNVEALDSFSEAIALDGALGNAWLGRGLIKIHLGRAREGRADLHVAATLEPQRSVLRSYLGKAFSHTYDIDRARKELALAKKLDPNDPTGWLYSALLHEQQNRINDAVKDLERSKELNKNRSLFRSRLLLDQDQAVRGANLAAIYRDAGLTEVSVQEAARAVNSDYGNYSAHLFLANSYDALRDPKLINLRYETPWFSELLVANLLAPVGGGYLSQNVSQQEYSRFFDTDHLGLFSSTEYRSRGDWLQRGSQYGVIGNTSYSLDAFYRTENGERPNNDLEQLNLSVRFKQQITPQDSILFEASYFDAESGDVAQYYYQHHNVPGVPSFSPGLRASETQEPNLLLGYHREWAPGSHTLFLASRFDDTLTLKDSAAAVLYLQSAISPFSGLTNISLRTAPFVSRLDYQSELVAYSAELQQIWQTASHTLVAGGRYQTASPEASSDLGRQTPLDPAPVTIVSQDFDTSLERVSVYGYDNWQLLDQLRLTAGVSYDRLHYPRNIDTAPITDREATKSQVSPKAGLIWSPWRDTHLRSYYAQSLGGVFFDNSVRLEPTQIAGFNQAFRSLIPESVIGLVPGTRFETWGVGLDQAFHKTGTYFVVDGQFLNSGASRTVGLLTNSDMLAPFPDSPSGTRQSLDYFEKSLVVAVNQLLGQQWSLGARYKLTHSDLHARYPDLPSATTGASGLDHVSGSLHQLTLDATYYHRCGFFAQANTVWSQQSNRGYSPDLPGDDFWQQNLYLGYRFWQRRAEAKLGLLNLSDHHYRLNPLTLYNELPRERTLVASLKWYF